jgi:hypothetical protein
MIRILQRVNTTSGLLVVALALTALAMILDHTRSFQIR